MQIKLTSIYITSDGLRMTDVWVNPAFVTSVLPSDQRDPSRKTVWDNASKIWVVGHAGYGTFSMHVKGTPAEVAELLNGDSKPTMRFDQQLLVDQCQRLLSMIDHPEPGLAGWNIAVETLVTRMRENLNGSNDSSRT